MIIACSNTLQITAKFNNFEIVNEFSYLRSLISNKGNCPEEIKRSEGMAKSVMTKPTKVCKDREFLLGLRSDLFIVDNMEGKTRDN